MINWRVFGIDIDASIGNRKAPLKPVESAITDPAHYRDDRIDTAVASDQVWLNWQLQIMPRLEVHSDAHQRTKCPSKAEIAS